MKKRASIIFFLILFSLFNIIPLSFCIEWEYVDNVYQINESKDDACHIIDLGYYDDDTILVVKSNLYDTKTGFIFDDIAILDNATFDKVYLSLYANDSWIDYLDYWVTIYGLDEDNSSSFSDFEDFNSRIETSNYVNWNLEDLEGYDTWVNSSNIADILNEIREREDWSGGNNIGLMIFSSRTWDSYRLAISYDGNSTYAPKLYVRYKYYIVEEPSEEEEFVETYRKYNITKNETEAGTTGLLGRDKSKINNVLDQPNYVFYSQQTFIGYSETYDYHIVVIANESEGISFWTSPDNEVLSWTEYDLTGHGETGGVARTAHNFEFWFDDTKIYGIQYRAGYTWIKYKEFQVNSDGSITLIGGWWEEFYDSDTVRSASICKTENGEVYVIYIIYDGANLYAKVDKNIAVDGNWTSSGGYPKTMSPNLGSSTDVDSMIVPINDNDGMLFVYCGYLHRLYSFEYDEDNGLFYNYVQHWSSTTLFDQPHFCISYYSNYTVGFVGYFVDDDIDYWRYETANNWTGKKLIYDHNADIYLHLGICISDTDTAYIVWSCAGTYPSQDWVVFTKSEDFGGTWTDNDGIEGNIEDWIDAQVEDIKFPPQANIFRKQTGAFIGFAWISDEPSAYYATIGGNQTDTYQETEDEIHYYVYNEYGELVAYCFEELEDAKDYIDSLIAEKIFSGNTLMWMIGLLGLIMMPLGFVLFVINAQKGDYSNAFYLLMVLFITGMGLFIAWMWG